MLNKDPDILFALLRKRAAFPADIPKEQMMHDILRVATKKVIYDVRGHHLDSLRVKEQIEKGRKLLRIKGGNVHFQVPMSELLEAASTNDLIETIKDFLKKNKAAIDMQMGE